MSHTNDFIYEMRRKKINIWSNEKPDWEMKNGICYIKFDNTMIYITFILWCGMSEVHKMREESELTHLSTRKSSLHQHYIQRRSASRIRLNTCTYSTRRYNDLLSYNSTAICIALLWYCVVHTNEPGYFFLYMYSHNLTFFILFLDIFIVCAIKFNVLILIIKIFYYNNKHFMIRINIYRLIKFNLCIL